MNEAEFWAKRIRPVVMRWGMAERIENGLAGSVPDVFYQLKGVAIGRPAVAGWIENKHRDTVPSWDSTIVFPPGRGLRKGQIAFWTLYGHNHGRGAILAGVAGMTWLFHPSRDLVREFNALTWGEFQYRGVLMTPLAAHAEYLHEQLCSLIKS